MSLKKLNFLYFIRHYSRSRIVSYRNSSMPAVTRYQKKQQQQQEQQEEVEISRNSRVKITTPSFVEASIRSYKVYSPNSKPKFGIQKTLTVDAEPYAAEPQAAVQEVEAAVHEVEAAEAAEILASLQYTNGADTSCMNSMTQVSVYMYRIAVYNISQTVHYKTAYILYDKKNRLYHVYSIVSNQIHATNHGASTSESAADARTEFTLPLPTNTIQFTYKSYIEDTITNFIMTMIIPSNAHDYYIQDDIFGLVIRPSEIQAKAFNEDSCYYDIEDIVYDKSSNETTNGFKAFMLIPSRHFWYWPAPAVVAATAAGSSSYHDNIYTSQTVNSVLTILSCSG